MTNRIKAVVIVLLLTAFLVTGCSNFKNKKEVPEEVSTSMSKYDPEIELSIPGGVLTMDGSGFDYLHNPWNDAYKNDLGINIIPKWEIDESTDTIEKFNEELATGVVPDIMVGLNRTQFEFVVRLGLAADLTGLVDEYATPLTKEILNSDGGYALAASSYDGKLYSLPYVYGNSDNINLMWIRTDWLKNLGLEYPKTSEELYTVLDAFVNKDPDQNGLNDTVGLCSTDTLWEVGPVFNMFGAQPFWSWYYDKDHILKYSTVSFTDNIKKSLSFLQKLYKNGLMYSEFGITGYDKYINMFKNGKAGIIFENKYFPLLVQEGVIENDNNADWQAFPIPTGLENNEPARPFSYYGPAAYNVISSKCKNPEAAVKMLNLYTEIKFSNDKDKYSSQFIIDKSGTSIENYAIYSSARANDLSEFELIADAVKNNDPSSLNSVEKIRYDSCMKFLAGDRKYWSDYKYYGPGSVSTTVLQYYMKDVKPFFSDYYGPDTPSMRQNITLLDSLWNEACTRIIMSGEDVNNYDDYVSEWYSLGGDKIESDINKMNSELNKDGKGTD